MFHLFNPENYTDFKNFNIEKECSIKCSVQPGPIEIMFDLIILGTTLHQLELHIPQGNQRMDLTQLLSLI